MGLLREDDDENENEDEEQDGNGYRERISRDGVSRAEALNPQSTRSGLPLLPTQEGGEGRGEEEFSSLERPSLRLSPHSFLVGRKGSNSATRLPRKQSCNLLETNKTASMRSGIPERDGGFMERAAPIQALRPVLLSIMPLAIAWRVRPATS